MKKIALLVLGVVLAATPRISQATSVSLVNPLGETDVRLIIARVISAALSLIGSFALLMFVYGGVLWLTSRGDTKAIQKGKDTLTWAILGLVVIFGAFVIVNTIISSLTTAS